MPYTLKIAAGFGLWLLSFLLPTVAFAERPFTATERAEPVGERQAVVEAALASGDYKNDRRLTDLLLGVRYGLLHDLEMGFHLHSVDAKQGRANDRAIGDVLFWGKAHLIHERAASPLSVAAKVSVKIPVAGKKEILGTTGDTDVELLAIVSKTFSHIASHINFGYLFNGASTRGKKREQMLYNLALEYRAEKRWSVFGELLGSDEVGDALSTGPWSLGGGTRYWLNERAAIDASAAFGLTDDAPQVGIGLGMTYTLF